MKIQLDSCNNQTIGVFLQEDAKMQNTVLDSRNGKNRTNHTIADLLPEGRFDKIGQLLFFDILY